MARLAGEEAGRTRVQQRALLARHRLLDLVARGDETRIQAQHEVALGHLRRGLGDERLAACGPGLDATVEDGEVLHAAGLQRPVDPRGCAEVGRAVAGIGDHHRRLGADAERLHEVGQLLFRRHQAGVGRRPAPLRVRRRHAAGDVAEFVRRASVVVLAVADVDHAQRRIGRGAGRADRG
jgi:hypothetical protein